MTTIREMLPNTGFAQAHTEQLEKLLSIVLAANADLKAYADKAHDFAEQFRRAFLASGYAFRRKEPDTSRYFNWHLEACNALLRDRLDVQPVSGPALLAAIIGHNDVPYRLGNSTVGQLLEVGLDWYSGLPCTNAWRDVLAGRPLISPTPPRTVQESFYPMPTPRIFVREPGGGMRELGADERMWR